MTSVDVCMLVDFYGNLLTEKMLNMIELKYFDDLSLSEIAEQTGVSRQAVHDTLKRAVSTLEQYEDKLGLIERFTNQKKIVEEAVDLIKRDKINDAVVQLEQLTEI
ncbi:MAG: YlxM family DNA-binding protein [Clostridia bacterium]|nr:YlxM family DNA-binding protein [Clostridia bacterium]